MKPFLVLLGEENTFAVYAPDSKSAADKVCRAAGYPGSTDEASAKVADEEARELFDDEFAEARRTNKPVRIVAE